MIPHYPQAGGEPVVHGAPEPADKGMEKDEADKAAQDGAGGSDDDDISRKLSFSSSAAAAAAATAEASSSASGSAAAKSAALKRAQKTDPSAYDNAYTNFGAHIDVHRWSCVGTEEEVRKYIIAPGRADTADENGWTCLHWACYAGQTETIRLVQQEGGVDINAQTRTGDTALHILCRNSNVEVFQMLLDLGADAHIKNDRGKQPYQLSRGETIFRTLTESSEPKRQAAPSSAAHQRKPDKPGAELVGKWVFIEYDEDSDDSEEEDASMQGESCWYRGRVESYDSNKGRHRLRWEDGSTSWVDSLKPDEYRLADEPSRRGGPQLKSPGRGSRSAKSSPNQRRKSDGNTAKQLVGPSTKSAEHSKSSSAGDGWTSAEDSLLLKLQHESPDMDWEEKTRLLGTGRTAKACQTRWLRHLCPKANPQGERGLAGVSPPAKGATKRSSSVAMTGGGLDRPQAEKRSRSQAAEAQPAAQQKVDGATSLVFGGQPRVARRTKFQDEAPPKPLATAAEQDVLVARAAEELFGSSSGAEQTLSEIWPSQLPTTTEDSAVGDLRSTMLFEHRRLRASFEDALRRELQRGPALWVKPLGRQVTPRAAASPHPDAAGRRHVITAVEAVAHTSARFAALRESVLQRQTFELVGFLSAKAL